MAKAKLGSIKAVDQVLVTSANLASDVTGTLPVGNGGTGQTSFTDGQLLIGNTTGNTLSKATLTQTANQVLVTNGNGTITLSLPQSIHTGATPQFTRLGLGAAANSVHVFTLAGGTVTVDTRLIDSSVTLNNGGVVFTLWRQNVTNTASGSGSAFIDLLVANVSQFKVALDGTVTAGAVLVGGNSVLTTASTVAVSQLATLNGFTDAAPALADRVPIYSAAATANRDTSVAELVGIAAEGFIQGCKLEYLTTTSIRVTPGVAQIQSTGKILRLAANDDTSPSLSSSTWYHVYLFDNGGTVDTEVSTTAPVVWLGTAASKSGDTSRRYLGSFRTNSSSQIYNFIYAGSGNEIFVLWRLIVSNEMRAVSAGTATTNAGGTFSVANMCPPGCRNVYARYFSNANQGLRTDSDDMTGTDPDSNLGYVAISTAGGDVYCPHPINSSQQLRYSFATTVTNGGGFYCDIYGYYLER